MHFCSTADLICPDCKAQTTLALMYIKENTAFDCGGCGRSVSFDPTRHTHDILMFEMGMKMFGDLGEAETD